MTRTFKIYSALIGIAIIFIDQATKYLAQNKIPADGIFIVDWNSFTVKLDVIANQFLAFGIKAPILSIAILSSLLIIFLAFVLTKSFARDNRAWFIALTAIIAAAMSNLLDRIVRGGVTDFISISLFHFNWPTFNFADIIITLTVLFLIIEELRSSKI